MTDAELLMAAAAALPRAHCPYSRYQVGAALLAKDGAVITGCNVENASYGLTLCAERVAVGTAVAAGHRDFKAIAVVSSGEPTPFPCGACRQVLAEFCPPDLPVHVATAGRLEAPETCTLQDLLPKAFSLRK